MFHGSDYIEAVKAGHIDENTVLMMLSIDGTQLYHDKESDCWFFVWIIHNLAPELRFKKKYILPGGFVPGPNSPDMTELFLLPSLRHFSALEKDGLKVWDDRARTEIKTEPFFAFGTADMVALLVLSRLVGHTGSTGCHLYCDIKGRRKREKSTYYPAVLKPDNYHVNNCLHPRLRHLHPTSIKSRQIYGKPVVDATADYPKHIQQAVS
jgi:hypothetical protein